MTFPSNSCLHVSGAARFILYICTRFFLKKDDIAYKEKRTPPPPARTILQGSDHWGGISCSFTVLPWGVMPKFPQKPNSVWYCTFSFNWSPWNLVCITGQIPLFPEKNVPKTRAGHLGRIAFCSSWQVRGFCYPHMQIRGWGCFTVVAGHGLRAYSLLLIHLLTSSALLWVIAPICVPRRKLHHLLCHEGQLYGADSDS